MAAELTLGAEEELHLIDLTTSKLSARAPQLLSRRPPRNYAAEIQRTTVETNTEARDGLRLSGWLHRVPGHLSGGPAMISLHGGPEAQERPAFNPQHQAMTQAGITEPWIAAAAVSKYGDPERDETLLNAISPLHAAANIDVPLVVVHGELDSNVPRSEAVQIVGALRRLGRPVEYLQLDGEGHEYRRADSRKILIRRMLHFLSDALTA